MKAMILAAGLGSRMRPLTDHTPKPLLDVQGKPLLAHHIERLFKAGCDEIVINVSYLAEQIEAFLSTEEYSDKKLHISYEAEPLETAGGIVNALPLLGDEPFLLLNGDVWIDYSLDRLVQLAQQRGLSKEGCPLAHLVMVTNPEHNVTGDFRLDSDSLSTSIPSASTCGSALLSMEAGESLTYSGVGLYCPSLFKDVDSGRRPLAPLLRAWIKEGKVAGEKYSGYWLDVGTPERLRDLNDRLQP
ncbi:MAG: nucleotidyltransferase family protein [Pseudomonadales bacterium]|nr:nucleotidyltransferase family protein [Pseudomonadales bacterium]